MKKWWVVGLCCLTLSACDNVENSWNAGAKNIRQGYDRTRWKVSDWFFKRDPEEFRKIPKATKYCYQVQMDLLCFARPQPELKNQLVGVQGEGLEGPASYYYEASTPAYHGNMDSTITSATIVSSDIDAPFEPASDETLRRAGIEGQGEGSSITVSGASGSSVTVSGAPKQLMSGY